MNQIPHQGAKSGHSEMRGSSQQSLSVNQQNIGDCHGNLSDNMQMQNNGQKKDSSRYGKDMSSSHNAGGFMPNNPNGRQRNIGGNGQYSNSNYPIGATSESMNMHAIGPYGGHFNNQANNRAKSQASDASYCGNGSTNSPYAAWPGLNSTSVSSTNGWNFQNNMSRKSHDTSSNSSMKDGKEEENMSVDGELSYSDLLGGATGGPEMNKQGSNGGNMNSSWGGSSRLGLLGSNEGSVNSSANWNGGQGGPMSNAAPMSNTWENNRQRSGTPSDSANDSMDMMNSQSSFSGLIGATGGSDIPEGKPNDEHYYKHDGMPPRLGLLGGGEGALNAASSGWGTSVPSSNSNSTWGGNGRSSGGNCDIGENNGSGMSPPKPHGSWAQAAGKGLNPHGLNGNGNGGQGTATSSSEQTSSTPDNATSDPPKPELIATENQIQAAKSEGWGLTPVNQDVPWDVPPSPPPAQPQNPAEVGAPGMEGGAPVWRQNPANNGTEIWQNNLRLNKGAPAAEASNTPPWGHTPATNIGGHWGDDDSASNMWSGVNPPNPNNPACWPEQNPAQNPTVWGGGQNPPPQPEKQWGGNAQWNDGADNGTAVWNGPLAKQRNVGGSWSPAATPKKDMQQQQQQQQQQSGWEMSPPQNRRAITGGNFDDGTGVWGNPQRQGKVSNWKDMPPAKQIVNSANGMNNPAGLPSMPLGGGMAASGQGMIRFPTGTNAGPKSDMGAPWNRAPPVNRNPGWQDMPSHDGPSIGTWGEDPMHMCNSMKNPSGASNSSVGGFGASWNDQSNSAGYWGAKPKGNANWSDGLVDTSSWLGPSKQGAKPLTRDLIWSCKQFRMLNELGFKKEDVENALRNNNMSFEDAFFELKGMDPSVPVDMDNFLGRKVRPASSNMSDDISMAENVLEASFSGGNFHGGNNFQSSNFQNMGGFKPQMKVHGQNNASNLLGSGMGTQNSNNALNFNLLQKLLQQQTQQQQQQQQQNSLQQQLAANIQLNNQGGNRGASNAYLRNLVQQIQMAIHAGHLNPQVLNQPLAPQTLQLLFQLLQQIRVLAQLQQQQLLHGPKMMTGGGPNNGNASLQINVQVTHTKQRILNLQNQIAAQQAIFLKGQMMHTTQNADIFKPTIETMPSLQSEFRDMSLKEVPLQAHQQSRLSQWKLPSYEKEDGNFCGQNSGNGTSSLSSNNEFIRAPGPLPSKNLSSASSSMPNNGPNLHPLLSQGDSAWSSLSHSQGDSGWPEPATSLTGVSLDNVSSANVNMDSKESSSTPPNSGPSTSSASHTSYNLTNLSDLVPEFEPGKPWKGTQLKNIEDDPHITPGSITRSPLSVNTIKDPDLFWNAKSSPAASSNNDASSSLASNTWNFQPTQTSVANSSSASGSSKPGAKWSTDAGNGSDVWGGSVSKPRGPPPGMGSQGSWDRQNSFTFLLLRNLTPQIDGSTLKTLCMQHGPLQLFHLSLNHGIALVRYATREEASKAQSALNNCVLGNTTILADIPNESEVQQYSILLTNQNSAGNMGWSGSSQQSSVSTAGFRSNSTSYPFNSTSGNNNSGSSTKMDSSGWNGSNMNMASSQLWSFPNASSALWGSSQPLGDHEPNSNSSLNRFLPDNLLGGESM